MNSVQLYIEEDLDEKTIANIKSMLMAIEHVVDVEISNKSPHEFVIDFEEHHNMPMRIIESLKEQGYHPDIFSG
ncbi:MAG: hypothetical protein PVG75_05245 [Thioalkalispiraceae bacterium]|jgi:hypothetical protein